MFISKITLVTQSWDGATLYIYQVGEEDAEMGQVVSIKCRTELLSIPYHEVSVVFATKDSKTIVTHKGCYVETIIEK